MFAFPFTGCDEFAGSAGDGTVRSLELPFSMGSFPGASLLIRSVFTSTFWRGWG